MFSLFLFLYITFSFCNCTTIKDYCVHCKNESYRLDKRNIKTISNLNQRIYNTTFKQTMLPFEYYHKEQDQVFYNSLHIKKRSKRLKPTNKNQKEETTDAKYLTEKLFRLFRKLDLGVNSDLLSELDQLRQKFNISETGGHVPPIYGIANETRFKLPIPTYEDNDEENSSYSTEFENITTMQTFFSEYEDDTTTEIEYFINETVTDVTNLDYDGNTEEIYEDDEVKFRQDIDSVAAKDKTPDPNETNTAEPSNSAKPDNKPKKTADTTKNGKETTIKASKTTAKEVTKRKTSKNPKGATGKDSNKTGTSAKGTKQSKGTTKAGDKTEGTTKMSKTTKTDSGETESTNVVTNMETTEPVNPFDDDDDEVVTIQRVKGIWIGGHCRCNYVIRSNAYKMNRKLGFLLCFLLLCLNYYVSFVIIKL